MAKQATGQSGRVCVFCGHDEVTNEHVFPQWLRDVLGPGPAEHARMLWDLEGNAMEQLAYPGKAFNLEVGRVCQQTCNGGWMSDLERAVRPILEPMLIGRAKPLGRDSQATLAAWAYKTALMLNFAVPEIVRAADPAEYQHLFRYRRPPRAAKIAVAAYSGVATASYRGHALHVGSKVVGDGAPYNGYTMTFSVGQAAFHVVHTTLPNQEVTYSGRDIAQMIRWIWPIQRELFVWTRRPALDEAHFVALADALGRRS
jgi:hypothetical protein